MSPYNPYKSEAHSTTFWCRGHSHCIMYGVTGAVFAPGMVSQKLSSHLRCAWCCHCACTTCSAVIVPAPHVVLSLCLHCTWCCSHPAIVLHVVPWLLPLHRA